RETAVSVSAGATECATSRESRGQTPPASLVVAAVWDTGPERPRNERTTPDGLARICAHRPGQGTRPAADKLVRPKRIRRRYYSRISVVIVLVPPNCAGSSERRRE